MVLSKRGLDASKFMCLTVDARRWVSFLHPYSLIEVLLKDMVFLGKYIHL